MAIIIVNSKVWDRVQEYYDNVSSKYPNTWNINDTINQINKIHQIINTFEKLTVWGREPKISYWKRMGWKETWGKNNPWHFAFEKRIDNNNVYIIIQDVEHQDDIRESKNKISLTGFQLRSIIRETLRKVLLTT